jgi:hypothetical protein
MKLWNAAPIKRESILPRRVRERTCTSGAWLRVRIVVESVALMCTSGGGGNIVASGKNGPFENRLLFAFDPEVYWDRGVDCGCGECYRGQERSG